MDDGHCCTGDLSDGEGEASGREDPGTFYKGSSRSRVLLRVPLDWEGNWKESGKWKPLGIRKQMSAGY